MHVFGSELTNQAPKDAFMECLLCFYSTGSGASIIMVIQFVRVLDLINVFECLYVVNEHCSREASTSYSCLAVREHIIDQNILKTKDQD